MLHCHLIQTDLDDQVIFLVDDVGRRALIEVLQTFHKTPVEMDLRIAGQMNIVLTPASHAVGMFRTASGTLTWSLTPEHAAKFVNLLGALTDGSHHYLDGQLDQLAVRVSWGEYPEGYFSASESAR
jgi:hypothetical protein